jgi:hypothetical protein
MFSHPGKEVPKLVKQAVLSLISRRVLMTAKDSYKLTARGQKICKMDAERKTDR